MGEVNDDHSLKDVQHLIDNRVVFNKRQLFLWSYDVDYAANLKFIVKFRAAPAKYVGTDPGHLGLAR